MIILPTKGRPTSLQRFVHQYYLTGGTLPIWVIFDAQDAYRYNEVKTPVHWRRISVPTGTPLGGIFEKIFSKYPNEPYYGMVADDVFPETMHWDTIIAEACQPDKIAWGRDDLQNERLPVHPFIGGDLVRNLGWWAAPGMKHWFVDNVWKNVADALNCGVYMPEVQMTHLHPVSGKSPMDRTYRDQPSHGADDAAYTEFMKKGFASAIERVKSLGTAVT